MKSEAKFRYDIFISYSHKDEVWVRGWLIPQLELSEIKYCVDFRDFEPGAPSVIEMERAIQSSQKTFLVLSKNYLESEWAEFESVMAQTLDPAARERRIIPLLIENLELPLRLKTLTYINFSDPSNLEEQLKRLIHAIGKQSRDRNNPRVLIVENDDSWINMTKEILGECEVESVESAEIGISKLESGAHYDLVIANLNLTDFDELSGLEILEYIRDHRPSLPRIVITGKPVLGPVYSTLFQGFQITEFMTKSEPNIPELRRLVRNILMPLRTGTSDFQERKEKLLNQLRKRYDEAVSRLSEGLKALDAYEGRLRREVGQRQAEELTRPDKVVLMKKREDYKTKYDSLFSRTLVSADSEELNNIEMECDNEW